MSGVVYVGCNAGDAMTDCEPGINDTPSTQCDPYTDASCPTPTCDTNDAACSQEDSPLDLANDRSRLKGLEPGVCDSIIVEERTESQ